MLISMKKPVSPVMNDGEDVVILRFQPHEFTEIDWVKKKINALLRRKINVQKEMTEEVYSFMKQWFSGEIEMSSHLFPGLNIFCIYDTSGKCYIALNKVSGSGITEKVIPFRMQTLPSNKTTFWMLESVERKPYAVVAGTYHEVSIICGIHF